MLDISLKIMGLNKDYTKEELELAYKTKLSIYKSKIVEDAYNELKQNLEKEERKNSDSKEIRLENKSYFSKINFNLAKALEFNFDNDLRTTLKNFEINSIKDSIRFFELSNYYDALKEYNKRYCHIFSKKYKKR